MKQEVLKAFDIQWLPVTALVLFLTSFILYTWWTYRAANKNFYEQLGKIPLDDKDIV